VAAIFPEHFQSFTLTLKNYFFEKILLPQNLSAVCQIINKNKKTHSAKKNRQKATRAVIVCRLGAGHNMKEMQNWLKENLTEVWVEEVWLPSLPDCKPLDYFVCGDSELRVKAKSRNKSKDLI
jgi:hypothetical protein